MLSRIPRVWLVAGGGWIGRIVQVLAQLVAIRIITDSLGATGYSVFAVLVSLAGWMALADFSLAISLQNFISERRVAGKPYDDLIMTASLLAMGAAIITSLLLLLLGPWLSAQLLGNFSSFSAQDRLLAFWGMTFPAIGTALGGVAYKIWFAEHRGYLSNLLPALGTALGTVGVWIVATAGASHPLPQSVFIYYIPSAVLPLIVLAVMMLRVWARNRATASLAAMLLRRAARFWLFGLLAASVLQVDFIIMAQVLSSQDIVIYSISSRVFGLVFFVYNALLLALWPVCAEGIAAGRWNQVFRLVRRYLGMGMLMVLAAGIGFAISRDLIIHILAPTVKVSIPFVVIGLSTLYIAVRIWSDTFSMLLQSMNDLATLWIALPVQSALSIGLQILGAHFAGLPGMICGLIMCFVLTVGWYLPRQCRLHARRSVDFEK